MLCINKIKTNFNHKLATTFALSAILLCSPVYSNDAEFLFYKLAQAENSKQFSSILLDTSQTDKVNPKANTSIPFNLRQFYESDYFSSRIDENDKPNETSSYSEFKKSTPPNKYLVDTVAESNETKAEEKFNPIDSANNFFSPIEQEETSLIPQNFETPIQDNDNIEKDNFYISASSEEFMSEINLDGRIINNINILGLKTISPETVLNKIDTQKGSFFNQQLLQKDLQKIYSTGYFSDNMSIEPTLRNDGTVDLEICVQENIKVTKVILTGNNVISESELTPFITRMNGLPQNLNEINSAIDKINDFYHEKGYILANVCSVDDNADGELIFNINEGVINEIKIIGNEHTKDYVIRRNIMTQPGSVYNEEYLKKDLAKVFSTQIFEEVNRDISPSDENNGTYNVIISIKEKATNSIALGGGIDTGLGAFGSISLREDNFLGKAQKLSLTGILGSGILLSDASIKNHMNYHVELSFFEPHFINADNSLMSKIYYREMGSWQIPLAIERRIGANIGVEHKVKGYDHLSTSFITGVEHIHLKEGDYNRISQLYNQYGLDIKNRAKQLTGGFFLNLSPGVKYSNLDTEENPREGIIAQARFTESVGVSDFNHTNGRLAGMVTRFFPVFKNSSFSLTAKAGIKVHGEEMPEVMAYRLGGPYTIRGYRMNGVGTGESFLMGSAELATPIPFVDRLKWDIFKKMRITFFVDAGKVFDPTVSSILYDRPLHAITAGIGLRVFVPGVGPISVDYGIPITNPGRNGSENGYFTFGTGGLNGMYGY